ncbi:MAG: tRNA (adenosine(37)-N6)-threonylcarbamoyltransferase complex ATPase subunit type 1 TsaE [Oscillospiraceae bacterium]|nr:tRNA (adenosine(37)-N6)-threonylcarbamoyltransferase complex ATPase subunit type 1 TsaE [Oscillospiraceae bacterium]
MLTVKSNAVIETHSYGALFAAELEPNSVVFLHGDLGAGKTHFVKGMAYGLEVKDIVTSPTFSLVNEYKGKKHKLFHFDLYRITSEDDLYAIGFYDYIGQGILAIEWAQNVPDLANEFAGELINVRIEKIDENKRTISFQPNIGF